ncbi:MAG: hypothetical protein ACM3UN_05655 [Bacillota bacterium]
MEASFKKFYFQEKDWIIVFPNLGNEGRKYLFYSVQLIDRRNKRNSPCAILVDIIDTPTFENGYPYTVGFFRGPVDELGNFDPDFLELRLVRCLEDFWKFLNDLNI